MVLQGKVRVHILRDILLLVIPVVAIWYVLLVGYEHSLTAQASLKVQSEQEKGNLIIANQIENAFAQFVADLLVVYNSSEFSEYVQKQDEQSLYGLSRLFVRINTQKDYILHQRFLDASGKELAQVDRSPGGLISLVKENELEDLSNSDLFLKTKTLAPRVLYVSKITKEHETETSITLALPVYRGSIFLGVAAIDFDACYLFSFLFAYQSSLTKELQFSLVDSQGMVLLTGDDSCQTLGTNLYALDSNLHNQLMQRDYGTFRSGANVYTFQALYPRTSERLSLTQGRVRLWTLVSTFRIDQLPGLTESFLLMHPLAKYGILFVLLVLGSAVVVVFHLRMGDKQQMRISSLISNYASDGIVVCDADGRITFCNQSFEQLSGYSQHELIGRLSNRFQRQIPLPGKPTWITQRSGHLLLVSLATTEIRTKRRKLENTVEIYSPSHWTPCTFLEQSTAAAFDANTSLASAMRLPSIPPNLTCLSFRLENSKEIGTQLNQTERSKFASDVTLVLARLTETPYPVLCFSFDFFVVLLPDRSLSSLTGAYIAGLLKNLSSSHTAKNMDLSIRMVCGVSFLPATSATLVDLIIDASLASRMVNIAKNERYLYYSEGVRTRFARQRSISEALKDVFSTNQISMYYQAQLSVETGTICGAEALIRWQHPTLGNIPPDEFLPLLFEMEEIEQLGRFVIQNVVHFLAEHSTLLLASCPTFSLSFNLSARELSNPALLDVLGSLLREFRIPDQLLTVELTEHTAVEDLASTNSMVEKLHAQGLSIAIDDFGTGFSSLSYLLELSIDTIKIDRSFIFKYPEVESTTIYKTVLLLAKEVGAKVVAEGVETEEQLAFLREIGCDQYQGYYFSPAVDAPAFLEQVKKNIRT
ncbi:EAL domain-containing protein [Sphaerochaeta sp.]|uniref:EAL domain-containing protein n=1 Tax=Sphaerochaeta sp. TaxID=1972642 RepID=UPI002FCC18A7